MKFRLSSIVKSKTSTGRFILEVHTRHVLVKQRRLLIAVGVGQHAGRQLLRVAHLVGWSDRRGRPGRGGTVEGYHGWTGRVSRTRHGGGTRRGGIAGLAVSGRNAGGI